MGFFMGAVGYVDRFLAAIPGARRIGYVTLEENSLNKLRDNLKKLGKEMATGDQDLDFVLGMPETGLSQGGYGTGQVADAAISGDLIRRGYGAIQAMFRRQARDNADTTRALSAHTADVTNRQNVFELGVLGEQGRVRADVDADIKRRDKNYAAFEVGVNTRLEKHEKDSEERLNNGLKVEREQAQADVVALGDRLAADRRAGEKTLREDYDAKLTAERQRSAMQLQARDEKIGRLEREKVESDAAVYAEIARLNQARIDSDAETDLAFAKLRARAGG